jgi:hypothetical protein
MKISLRKIIIIYTALEIMKKKRCITFIIILNTQSAPAQRAKSIIIAGIHNYNMFFDDMPMTWNVKLIIECE